MIKQYAVSCKKCKNKDDILIDDKNNIYWKQTEHIISGRYRLDMQWGWQCKCGNNDLLTRQEKTEINNLQEPDAIDIQKVLKNLVPDKSTFIMKELKG